MGIPSKRCAALDFSRRLRMGGNRRLPFPLSVLTATTVVGAIACVGSSGLAQSPSTVAIEKMDVGTAPADFEFGRTGQGQQGKWVVVGDASAEGGHAIEQSSADRTDYRFPLAIYRPVVAKDVDVLVRFKAVAGSVDRAGGVAVRLIDPDNYYVVRANALENNVRFYRVIKGNRVQIAGANTKVSANEWHTL